MRNADRQAAPIDALERLTLAMQGRGDTQGRSGVGQENPHHGFDNRDGSTFTSELVDSAAEFPEPMMGTTYQCGGTGLDRDVLEEERKAKERGGSWKSPRVPRGARDPSPGAPVNRRR
ncbi:hypothetical protein [Dyella sp. GSA-30]|uniref:hypothetical protein n=1 Tax=Dyella sp. GSA-30 TaxID=2994496 RepID=UPI0024908E10|nr:hypothetical protein [Dyella sp. GSA-30]BDU20782.1 hypothetical protein DYGSA30_22390 [Dyella sp. GSA-30]